MSHSSEPYIHLTVGIVKEIHAEAISRFGGSLGLRDLSLLESAIAAPQATMFGEPMFGELVEVAAAYLFYLCRNHPFVDGNKRVALGGCIVFLRLNGMTPKPDSPDWEVLTLDVAASRLDREATTERLRALLLFRASHD